MSVFTYAIEVWACAYGGKYLSKIDKFCKRAWNYGYTRERSDAIHISDKQLWKKITATDTHCLTDLLPNFINLYVNMVMTICYPEFAQSALSAAL